MSFFTISFIRRKISKENILSMQNETFKLGKWESKVVNNDGEQIRVNSLSMEKEKISFNLCSLCHCFGHNSIEVIRGKLGCQHGSLGKRLSAKINTTQENRQIDSTLNMGGRHTNLIKHRKLDYREET